MTIVMQQISPPVFGKRNVPRGPAQQQQPQQIQQPQLQPQAETGMSPTVALDATQPDYETFFAAVRAEMTESAERRVQVVPWSWNAAALTGLVVGCALVGFDVTGGAGADRFKVVVGLLGVQVDGSKLLPAMIALGLVAGARVAGMTVFCAHAALSKAGWTSYPAYALGGGAASAAFAALTLAVTGHPPAHGWVVELMAGTGAGLCYRAIAGIHGKAKA